MSKQFFFGAFLAVNLSSSIYLSAQDRGVSPVATPSGATARVASATRAVVVGISDYQDPAIPDLRFADRDAQAFAAWLQSAAGGSLPPENIKLLTNKAATTGAIASAMDWLIAEGKTGDRAIIYFSGHGDVETRTKFQRGFLLTYDSPPTNYLAGAFALIFLQDIISTLSDNGVQVIMISDACHAGKLAGSDIGGSQATAANLSKQFANEIKIMSCQPDEFSLEGEQWGGGRGCFSYHLIDGLTGMADGNTDKQVNLLEIGQYLQTKVPAETDPQSQIPLAVGSMKTVLADVDEASLRTLREQKGKALPAIAAIETKGFEQVVLAGTDSIWQKKYNQFTTALQKGDLLEPAGASAYDRYTELSKVPELERLHGIMKRNLATALQDESQQAINAYLRADEEELAAQSRGDLKYTKFVRYLEKAAELLGEGHYMYKTLKAKQYYFDAVDIRIRFEWRTISMADSTLIWNNQRKDLIQKALELEENAAFIQFEKGLLADSGAIYYYKKAIELAPKWVLPYVQTTYLLRWAGKEEEADSYWTKAMAIAPQSSMVYLALAEIHLSMKEYEQAKESIQKAIQTSPGNVWFLEVLGWVYTMQKEYREAENTWLKALELSPDNNELYNYLSELYLTKTYEFDKAEAINRKRMEKRPTDGDAYADLVSLYWGKQPEKIRLLIEEMKRINDSVENWEGQATIGFAYNAINEPEKAIPYLQQALKVAPTSPSIYTIYAGAYRQLGDYEKFLALLDTGIAKGLPYEGVEAYLGVPEAYKTPGYKAFAQRVIDNRPKMGFGYSLMGKYYEGQGDFASAAGYYKQAVTLSPERVYNWSDYCQFAYLLGQTETADSCIRQLLSLDAPAYIYDILGMFFRNHGDYERAEQLLQQSIALNKHFFAPYEKLALLHHAFGEYKKAMAALQQGMAEAPDAWELREMHTLFSYFAYPRDKARQIFEKAATEQPAYLQVWNFLEQMDKKDYGGAIQAWKLIDSKIRTWYLVYMYLGALVQHGDMDAAIELLNKTDNGALNYRLLSTNPLLEPLRKEPAYREYIRKNFPEKLKDE